MNYIYIAVFGALGAAARFWIGSSLVTGTFPAGTLLVNLIGCFLLAVTVRYLTTLPWLSKKLINGIGVGFIGSFTTFSSFSAEVSGMLSHGNGFPALCYILTSILGGFVSAGLGFLFSERLIRRKERSENGG